MSSEEDQSVELPTPEDRVPASGRNVKRPTLMIVAVFYAILFCLVITGFFIALSLTN